MSAGGTAVLRHLPLIAILALQTICCLYLVGGMVLSVAGIYLPPLAWAYEEALEIGAALGLIAGIAIGASMLIGSLRRSRRAEARLKRAQSAFGDLTEQRFADWGLSPAERDVALFAIKGLSVGEIAQVRGTSEGTVKAQTAAVYRKAGVANRHQLLSLFIEDLFDPALPRPGTPPSRPAPMTQPATTRVPATPDHPTGDAA